MSAYTDRSLMLDVEANGHWMAGRGWPPRQPARSTYFQLFPGTARSLYATYFVLVVVASCAGYLLLCAVLPPLLLLCVAALGLAAVAAAVLAALCGCPACLVLCFFRSWGLPPWSWPGDGYVKLMFLVYQSRLRGHTQPSATERDMPIGKMRPKRVLEKRGIDYALNVEVPTWNEEEFSDEGVPFGNRERFNELLPSLFTHTDDFKAFTPGENPVKFVMDRLGSVYPEVVQPWVDKLSDEAFARFCCSGLGAHRVESVLEGGRRLFVIRTNALSALPVRAGYSRYGGDAYFDAKWRPVKVVDEGLGEFNNDGSADAVVTSPGMPGWEHAKFRVRSSLSVLVTVVDHLYGVHLGVSNLFVTATREQLSPAHPVRRFLTPFMYSTISVNANARKHLIQPKSFAPRCFAVTSKGLELAFAAAPSLLTSGLEVPVSEGGPLLNRAKYAEWLKKRGIDTEYHRQAARLFGIFKVFLVDYLDAYYQTPAHVVADVEVQAMLKQFRHQSTMVSLRQGGSVPGSDPQAAYEAFVDVLAGFMLLATAGHEQVGSIQEYMQDASFCAFKWVPGAMVGTKECALNQALLMSFTSTKMPQLMGSDWSHLFPPVHPRLMSEPSPQSKWPLGAGCRKTPRQSFHDFQIALASMAADCDKHNLSAMAKPFPHNFPLHVLNPRFLETSISV